MNRFLLGWSEIFNFLGVNYCETDKKRGETWSEWSKRKGCELVSQGCPIVFLPMIDREPRLYPADAVRWANEFFQARLAAHHIMRREKAAETEEEASKGEATATE